MIKVDEDYTMTYTTEEIHKHGVGLLIHTKMSNKIHAVISKSGRVLFVRLEIKPKPIV